MLKTKYNKKNKQIKNKTKKRKNIKKTLRKKIKLVGGSRNLTPIQNLNYTYIATLGTTGKEGTSNNKFNNPKGVAVSANNRIYVADTHNQRVQVFDGTTRQYIATLGTTGKEGTSNTEFNGPSGVAVSADNRIYVTDQNNNRVQVFDGATRNYIDTLGTTGSRGASNTQFYYPSGVAVSADNCIYVTEFNNHRVQIFKDNLPSYYNAIIRPPLYDNRNLTSPPPPKYSVTH